VKSNVKKLEGTSRQIDIELPRETVDKVFDEVLQDIRKKSQIPGFRPGKAPLEMVQKMHQQDAMDEVARRLVPMAYEQALSKHEMKPVNFPEVTDVNFGPSGTLTFRAKVDVHPEIKLQKYKGLKVTRKKVSVKDEEVDETLTRFRNMFAEFTDTDRPIQKGDFGVCAVETFVDGESISKKRENMWIEADKEESMLGLGEELCGMNKGDTKDIEATLPKEYPDKKFAGKKAVFRVELKETKEKKLPDVDDELAKKLGKDTLAEAREEIKTQLLERKDQNEKVSMKNQIMGELLRRHSFALPPTMVKRQLKVLMDRAENELTKKGVDKDAIKSHEDKLTAQLNVEAENKVRLYFILDAVADRENIEVTDEEVDNWLSALAGSYNQPFEEVKKYYEEHDLIGGLKEQLREEKTLDFLLSEAAVSD